MASLRRNMVVVMVAVAAAAMLLTVSGAECPDELIPLVYPYWSLCWSPARYYGEEVYELAVSKGVVRGSLAPEYDESNSTYYLRLADKGAKYKFTHLTRELRPFVTQSDTLQIVNVETGRSLGWRQEGEDEFFLVEIDEFAGLASFRFAATAVETVPLVCPKIFGARCQAYYVVDSSSRGLSPYVEDDVTYVKKGSDTGLPFLLLRSSTDDSVLATPA